MPYLGNIPSPIILQDVLGNYNFDYGTLYIDSVNNRVGIGTDSPSGKLHIVDTNASYLFTSNSTSSYNTTFNMDNTGLDIGHNSASRSINFLTNSLDRMTITGAGNVGIGTSAPSGTLDVRGSGNYYFGNVSNPRFRLLNTGGTASTFIVGSDSGGVWLGAETNSFLYFISNNTERMRIDASGNVGIGTSSPKASLHISGSAILQQTYQTYLVNAYYDGAWKYIENGMAWGIGNNFGGPTNGMCIATAAVNSSGNDAALTWTPRLNIDSSGNVGIGTSSPSSLLHVKHPSGNLYTRFEGYSNLFLSKMYISSTSSGDGGIQYDASNNTMDIFSYGDMKFNVGTGNISGSIANERMRITSAGNVGIGTVSPGYRLHVGESSGIAIYASSSTNHGVYGISDSQYGVVGISNSGIGTFGQSSSSPGVYGTSSTGTGLYGLSTSNYGAFGQSTNNYGIYGRTLNSGFGGILGYNYDASKYAILGHSTNYAIYGAGDAYFSGALSKGSGSFNIPHPLPELSETHRLVHSFVEAPTADNIYRGRLQLENGQATVNIDTHVGMTEGTFSALNGNIQVFLQNDSGWDLVRGSVSDNILTIISQNQSSTDTISWMVIGERQDQHMLDTQWTDEFGRPILEPLKEPEPEIQLPPEPEVPNENG